MKYRLTATKKFTVEVVADSEDDAIKEANMVLEIQGVEPADWEIEEIKE